MVKLVLTMVSGGLVGLTLGLLGGGGSILAVPLLLYVVGLDQPHRVIGTTALAVALNAFANLVPHWRAGHVCWREAAAFTAPGLAGAFAGSSLGKAVRGPALLALFAVLMLVVAVVMWRRAPAAAPRSAPAGAGEVGRPCRLPAAAPRALVRTGATGLLVGALSGFFGIGGGFLVVPGLVLATGMPMILAVGTSLFAVGTFGLTTAVNYALSGLVSLPIMAEYLAGGLAGGWLGVRWATRLAAARGVLNRLFAAFVAVVAAYMLAMNVPVLWR